MSGVPSRLTSPGPATDDAEVVVVAPSGSVSLSSRAQVAPEKTTALPRCRPRPRRRRSSARHEVGPAVVIDVPDARHRPAEIVVGESLGIDRAADQSRASGPSRAPRCRARTRPPGRPCRRRRRSPGSRRRRRLLPPPRRGRRSPRLRPRGRSGPAPSSPRSSPRRPRRRSRRRGRCRSPPRRGGRRFRPSSQSQGAVTPSPSASGPSSVLPSQSSSAALQRSAAPGRTRGSALLQSPAQAATPSASSSSSTGPSQSSSTALQRSSAPGPTEPVGIVAVQERGSAVPVAVRLEGEDHHLPGVLALRQRGALGPGQDLRLAAAADVGDRGERGPEVVGPSRGRIDEAVQHRAVRPGEDRHPPRVRRRSIVLGGPGHDIRDPVAVDVGQRRHRRAEVVVGQARRIGQPADQRAGRAGEDQHAAGVAPLRRVVVVGPGQHVGDQVAVDVADPAHRDPEVVVVCPAGVGQLAQLRARSPRRRARRFPRRPHPARRRSRRRPRSR